MDLSFDDKAGQAFNQGGSSFMGFGLVDTNKNKTPSLGFNHAWAHNENDTSAWGQGNTFGFNHAWANFGIEPKRKKR